MIGEEPPYRPLGPARNEGSAGRTMAGKRLALVTGGNRRLGIWAPSQDPAARCALPRMPPGSDGAAASSLISRERAPHHGLRGLIAGPGLGASLPGLVRRLRMP